MWFDLVLIDKVFANGALLSAHIRADNRSSFPVDRLEDIEESFRPVNTKDVGPLRLYEHDNVTTRFLESQLKNFQFDNSQISFQLDHFGIPVVSGYYAIIFPRGWRLVALNIYDPYDPTENPASKRQYRGVDVIWDGSERTSFAQFNMESKRRNYFSIGVIATLCPADAEVEWIDRPGRLSVAFTDYRHRGQRDEEGYRNVSDKVTKFAESSDKMPGLNLSLSGPSLDIVAWGHFLLGKIRRTTR